MVVITFTLFASFPEIFLKKNEKVYVVKGMCWATPSPCVRNADKKTKIKYGYKIYLNN